MRIAVTGGIGSGKSAVMDILKEKKHPVFSCDEIYKEIIRDSLYIKRIGEAFPSCIKNGEIDRAELSKIVFKDKNLLNRLNEISHPLIMQRLLQKMGDIESGLIFAEVPLLFEGGFADLFDAILVVRRDMRLRLRAVALRDGLANEEIIKRMSAQFNYDKQPESFYQNPKIFKIFNNSTLDNLKREVDIALQTVKKRGIF